MNGLIGKKIGMTRVFDEKGRHIPVTVIEAGPCVVTQFKTPAADGYAAVQLGFGGRKAANTTMPMQGHFRRAGVEPVRILREFIPNEGEELALGDAVDVSILEGIQKVDVTGITKGRGFSGRIKRWNEHRGPAGHGSKNVRMSGSIGMHTKPGRVFKNTRMAGQYGNKRETKKNLTVVRIDAERNLLLVKGSVPGSKNGLVLIRISGRVSGSTETQVRG
ncbi:50S ribosomal protein L3 [bacterium]|nr:50S ribosomal protein L3 [bacterium]MBU1073532.1 50S ribosomal protein L3 [bacterium]